MGGRWPAVFTYMGSYNLIERFKLDTIAVRGELLQSGYVGVLYGYTKSTETSYSRKILSKLPMPIPKAIYVRTSLLLKTVRTIFKR